MAIDKTQSFFIDKKYKREVESKLPYDKILADTADGLDNDITIIGLDSSVGAWYAFKNKKPDTWTIITLTPSVDNIHLIDNDTNTYYNEKTLSPKVKIFYLIPEIDTSS